MLGIIFVLLVCFLRRGIIGGVADLIALSRGGREAHSADELGEILDVRNEFNLPLAAVAAQDSAGRRRLCAGRSWKLGAFRSDTAA